jgi:hypothetical protein
MIRGVSLTIHKENGTLMKGNRHHLKLKRIVIELGKRKDYAG